MEKRFWIIIGVIAVIFIGFLWFSGKDDAKNHTSGTGQPTNHVKGKADSQVKLVEYGDFQCPTCGAYYPTVEQVVEKYKDQISFQFRNLPLTQIHQNAFAAARAAEAASAQGKFWDMYNLLFQNQQSWSSTKSPQELFNQYASQLNLDLEKFKTDFASNTVNSAINGDLAVFKETGASLGTPTFFLNGKKLELKDLADNNQPSVEKFSKIIDDALKQ